MYSIGAIKSGKHYNKQKMTDRQTSYKNQHKKQENLGGLKVTQVL